MPHLIDKETGLCLVCQRLELAALKERSKFKRIKYDVRQFYIDQITDKSDPNYRRIVNNHYVHMSDENYEKLQRLHSSSSSINSNNSILRNPNIVLSEHLIPTSSSYPLSFTGQKPISRSQSMQTNRERHIADVILEKIDENEELFAASTGDTIGKENFVYSLRPPNQKKPSSVIVKQRPNTYSANFQRLISAPNRKLTSRINLKRPFSRILVKRRKRTEPIMYNPNVVSNPNNHIVITQTNPRLAPLNQPVTIVRQVQRPILTPSTNSSALDNYSNRPSNTKVAPLTLYPYKEPAVVAKDSFNSRKETINSSQPRKAIEEKPELAEEISIISEESENYEQKEKSQKKLLSGFHPFYDKDSDTLSLQCCTCCIGCWRKCSTRCTGCENFISCPIYCWLCIILPIFLLLCGGVVATALYAAGIYGS